MRLRNFPLKCIPCCYDLLSYHAQVFEVITHIGELRIWSLDLDYLNKSFKELQISFELSCELKCTNIFDSESSLLISFSKFTTKEQLEKYITDKIVERFVTSEGEISNIRLDMMEHCIKLSKIKDTI